MSLVEFLGFWAPAWPLTMWFCFEFLQEDKEKKTRGEYYNIHVILLQTTSTRAAVFGGLGMYGGLM